MQRPAKPCTPVRFRPPPPNSAMNALPIRVFPVALIVQTAVRTVRKTLRSSITDYAGRVTSARVACLSLMPYPQEADHIERLIEAIERKVPGRTLRDDKLPNVIVDSAPDEWMG